MKKSTLILLISTAIFFTSTLVLLYLNYLKPTTTFIPTTGTIPTDTPLPTTDPTTDWKTFENNNYSYSFKYPSSWNIVDLTQGKQVEIFFQTNQTDSVGSLLIEKINNVPTDISLYKETKKIGNYPNAKCSPELNGKSYCYLATGDKLMILIHKYPEDTEYNQTLDQILSTFIFTSPAATPTKILSASPTRIPTKITEKINPNSYCGQYGYDNNRVSNYPPRPAFGPSPLSVMLSPSGGVGSGISLLGFQWDFEGDGIWDSTAETRITHTYKNNGTFTPKFRVKGSDGSFGPTCTYPFNVTVSDSSVEFQNDTIAVSKLNFEFTVSKSKQNYTFDNDQIIFNNLGNNRIALPAFSVSSKNSFTAIRFKDKYNSLFGIYEAGNDLYQGTSALYHFFIDISQPNGVYEGQNQITYTTNNGTVTNDGPIIRYKITLTD